jgi:hypothetical protein
MDKPVEQVSAQPALTKSERPGSRLRFTEEAA